jgi:HTH-type transcriptional regulator/antitoxin HigA
MANPYTYEFQDVLHPGETVIEYLEFNHWSQRDLARRTGLTPKTISEICNGKAPITPPTSLALEKAFQRPAHFWLNLQRQYDEAVVRRRAASEAEGWKEWARKFPISEWKEWARRFPISELKKRGLWQPPPGLSEVEEVLMFLGVSSPASWEKVWSATQVAYRQTRRFTTSEEAIAVWVRATELYAAQLSVSRFDERRLRSSLPALRHQTTRRAAEIMEPVQEICGAAGVAVVWVPELPHTRISGCARWLSDDKALIALTLRYKTDDQMWFTFFHELGHILLRDKRHSFILDNPADDLSDRVVDPQMQMHEEEANRFAADTLIPPAELELFLAAGDFGSDSIRDFSESVDIGPGIVVGRLQFENILKRYQGNNFKQKLDYGVSPTG